MVQILDHSIDKFVYLKYHQNIILKLMNLHDMNINKTKKNAKILLKNC